MWRRVSRARSFAKAKVVSNERSHRVAVIDPQRWWLWPDFRNKFYITCSRGCCSFLKRLACLEVKGAAAIGVCLCVSVCGDPRCMSQCDGGAK